MVVEGESEDSWVVKRVIVNEGRFRAGYGRAD